MKNSLKRYAPEFLLKTYRKVSSNLNNKVQCLICKSKFEEFGTFGVIPKITIRTSSDQYE